MQVKNFEDLEIWKDARLLMKVNLPADQGREVRKRLCAAGSNPSSSGVDHVEYCGRVRARRESGIHSVSICRQSIVRRSSLATLGSLRPILSHAKRL